MPQLEGIESRYPPTKVHLQVYDETCHVVSAPDCQHFLFRALD